MGDWLDKEIARLKAKLGLPEQYEDDGKYHPMWKLDNFGISSDTIKARIKELENKPEDK